MSLSMTRRPWPTSRCVLAHNAWSCTSHAAQRRYGMINRTSDGQMREEQNRCGWRALMTAVIVAAVALAACSREPRPTRQDPANPNRRSTGFIDRPGPNQTVGSKVIVTGWAIDESGVQRVRVYADDRLVAIVPLTVARPDIQEAFASYAQPGALHGWVAEIDFGEQVGDCMIHAEALDGRGALTRFAYVPVLIQP
jgi:hypothetical protein